MVNLEMVFGLGPCGFYLGHRIQYRNQTLPTLTMHEAPVLSPSDGSVSKRNETRGSVQEQDAKVT